MSKLLMHSILIGKGIISFVTKDDLKIKNDDDNMHMKLYTANTRRYKMFLIARFSLGVMLRITKS